MVAGGHHVVGGNGLINTKVYNINEYPWTQDRSSGGGREKGQQGVRQGGQQDDYGNGHYPWSSSSGGSNDYDYNHLDGQYSWPPYGGNRRVISDHSDGDTSSASVFSVSYLQRCGFSFVPTLLFIFAF